MIRRAQDHLRTNMIGYLALFAALSGTAYAAGQVGSKQIRANAVKSKHIAPSAVATKDIRDSAIRSRDVRDGGLRAGDVAGLAPVMAKVAEIDGQLNGAGGFASRLKALEDDAAARDQRVTNLEDGLTKVEDDVASLSSKLDSDVDSLNSQIAALTGDVTGLTSDVTGLQNDDQSLDARLDSVCAQADAANQELNDLITANPLFILTGVSLPNYDVANCQG